MYISIGRMDFSWGRLYCFNFSSCLYFCDEICSCGISTSFVNSVFDDGQGRLGKNMGSMGQVGT